MSNVPYPVDERDTQWERELIDLRLFIYRSNGVHDVYDLDQTSLANALTWLRSQTPADAKYAVALRVKEEGRPGLVWLLSSDENQPTFL